MHGILNPSFLKELFLLPQKELSSPIMKKFDEKITKNKRLF